MVVDFWLERSQSHQLSLALDGLTSIMQQQINNIIATTNLSLNTLNVSGNCNFSGQCSFNDDLFLGSRQNMSKIINV